jgi:hypothetical protein
MSVATTSVRSRRRQSRPPETTPTTRCPSISTPGQEFVATFDRGRILQVASILLDNAAKYTPNGGSVTVGVNEHDERVELAVSDTDVGIPEDELPLIFERFHRADAAHPGRRGSRPLHRTPDRRSTRRYLRSHEQARRRIRVCARVAPPKAAPGGSRRTRITDISAGQHLSYPDVHLAG